MPQTSLLAGVRRLLNILVEGYTTLNRRLWVLAIPIGLDLYLWLGPRISLRGLLEGVIALSRQVPQANPETTAAFQEWAERSDLAGLIASPLTSPLFPALGQPARPGYAAPAWVPASPVLLFLAGLATVALLLLFWSLYLLPLADIVRGSGESGVQMLRRVPATWGRIALYSGMVVLGGIVLFFGISLVAALAQLLSGGLALLVLTLAGVLGVWALLFLYLVPSAILLSGVGPLRAIAYSVQVVRARMWSAMGFLLLTTMVRAGTTALWDRLAGQPGWVFLGILANGYVVAGLAAAGLVFYREGLRDWLGRQGKEKVVQ